MSPPPLADGKTSLAPTSFSSVQRLQLNLLLVLGTGHTGFHRWGVEDGGHYRAASSLGPCYGRPTGNRQAIARVILTRHLLGMASCPLFTHLLGVACASSLHDTCPNAHTHPPATLPTSLHR